MNRTPRAIALDMLIEWDGGTSFCHQILRRGEALYDKLDKRDKSFIKCLFTGTVERLITLDYIIDAVATVKTANEEPFVRNLLRLSVYQIFYMDSVPDRAAVSEALKLCEDGEHERAKGFVNAVLRNVARKGMPDYPDLSVTYSMPQWIVKLLQDEHGDEAEQILAGFMQKRPIETYILSGGGGTTGAIVMDSGAQRAVLAAGIRPGDTVVDVCAAPGGKAIMAASLAGPTGEVYAYDITERKVRTLQYNIASTGLTNIKTGVCDARMPDRSLAGQADVVICDVPCTGLGVIARKPDVKYRKHPSDIDSLVALGRDIIDGAVTYLKPGGTLLYATCTIDSRENENQTQEAASRHSLLVTQERQLLPGIDDTDGFYYAVLKNSI